MNNSCETCFHDTIFPKVRLAVQYVQWFRLLSFQIQCLMMEVYNKVLTYNNVFLCCCSDEVTEVDQGLFTDSYCKVCSAQLISESQRVAHYEVRPAFCLHHVCLYVQFSFCPFVCLMLVILDVVIQSVLTGTIPLEQSEVKCLQGQWLACFLDIFYKYS